jgi:hypothetical protein
MGTNMHGYRVSAYTLSLLFFGEKFCKIGKGSRNRRFSSSERKPRTRAWLHGKLMIMVKHNGIDIYVYFKPMEEKSGHNTHRYGTPECCLSHPIEYSPMWRQNLTVNTCMRRTWRHILLRFHRTIKPASHIKKLRIVLYVAVFCNKIKRFV